MEKGRILDKKIDYVCDYQNNKEFIFQNIMCCGYSNYDSVSFTSFPLLFKTKNAVFSVGDNETAL